MTDRSISSDLTDRFEYDSFAMGCVHSKFDGVINVLFPFEFYTLITFLKPIYRGIPDSVVLSDETFTRLSECAVGSKVIKRGTIFEFGEVSVMIENNCCSYFSGVCQTRRTAHVTALAQAIADCTSYKCKRGLLGTQSRDWAVTLLNDCCEAVRLREVDRLTRALARGTGFGNGLTPSFDDAVVGCLGVSFAAGCDAIIRERADELFRLVERRTTAVSLKYLACAFEGRFSQPVRDTITAVTEDDGIPSAVASLMAVGSSSGQDMLLGISIALPHFFDGV